VTSVPTDLLLAGRRGPEAVATVETARIPQTSQ
jgi:hypothetical protein